MKEFKLKNGICVGYKNNPNTPRIALTLNIKINEEEITPGVYALMSRLLQQGTSTYTSEELANILDENAIEFSSELKQDYLSFRVVCLNEDFNLSLNLLDDIVKNSTFQEFDKELIKLKGEYSAELDSNRAKVSDEFIKTIFAGHMYGHTYTTVLENVDNITKDDVINAYKNILYHGKKIISVVGDISSNDLENFLNCTLADLPNDDIKSDTIKIPVLEKQKYSEINKADAQQAQILQGWLVPTVNSVEYPAIAVLNTILGASGLSSRLFLELRDKKGLAYTVRSAYRSFEKSALFHIYIGTEPKNVEVSLRGFEEEINKIKTIPVTNEELKAAKNNILGRQQFISETNAQQANISANYAIMGFGFNFQQTLIENIKNVTPQMVMDAANKFLNNNYVIAIICP